ncbi:hypothetical protein COEREDRAFT_83438, partial [Coemansia reversa NRRL 1564]
MARNKQSITTRSCMWLPTRKRSNKKLLTNSGNVCSNVNTTRSNIDCALWIDRDAGVAFKKKNTAFLHVRRPLYERV